MDPVGDRRTDAACPECQGAGWIVRERKDGSRGAVRCSCHRDRMVRRLLAEAGLPPRYDHCTLEGYEPQNPSQRKAMARTRDLVDAYPAVGKGLLYLGPCGVGKTHLAVAALRELVRSKGVAGRFTDYTSLLRRIQDSYNPVSQSTEMQLLRPLLRAELLVLDDLGGAKRPTPWVYDTLFLILNSRYNEERLTLITSNFEDIGYEDHAADARRHVGEDSLADRVGERLRSRLYEMCDVLHVDGPDWRKSRAGGQR